VLKVGKNVDFKGVSITNHKVHIKVKVDRLSKSFKRAQYELDGMIMDGMITFMPMANGLFIQTTRARSTALQGTGVVCAGTGPQGHFLYEGKVMIDPVTKSAYARPGAKKVVTDKELKFNKMAHPDAQKKWFYPAKERDLKMWVNKTKKTAGGK